MESRDIRISLQIYSTIRNARLARKDCEINNITGEKWDRSSIPPLRRWNFVVRIAGPGEHRNRRKRSRWWSGFDEESVSFGGVPPRMADRRRTGRGDRPVSFVPAAAWPRRSAAAENGRLCAVRKRRGHPRSCGQHGAGPRLRRRLAGRADAADGCARRAIPGGRC